MTKDDHRSWEQRQQNPNEREQNPEQNIRNTSADRGDNVPASARDLGELIRSALEGYKE